MHFAAADTPMLDPKSGVLCTLGQSGFFNPNTLISALFVSLCHCSKRTILRLAECIHVVMCPFTFHRSFAGAVNVNVADCY